ncbi:hypothetical protein NC653_011052 [Populus alba x Populus x berolinensis]|uniref:Uncharacterized protein n=1 Tax=Populus alba x Populus x berolinensis TaxID=444605 RepID=A0AAD6W6G0_9ROSI|nr:hypothetical protein NC653_011052 [Populus alba x Populus x berolinensis]
MTLLTFTCNYLREIKAQGSHLLKFKLEEASRVFIEQERSNFFPPAASQCSENTQPMKQAGEKIPRENVRVEVSTFCTAENTNIS